MNEDFKNKLNKIKETLNNVDTTKPINEKYETNMGYYVNKIIEYIESNPTRSYYPQNTMCNDVLGGCDVEIAIKACNILKEHKVFQISFIHNSYDDCDHEVEHEMEESEFITAMHDHKYTPINQHTGHPMEYYMPKWISFVCYASLNYDIVEGFDF